MKPEKIQELDEQLTTARTAEAVRLLALAEEIGLLDYEATRKVLRARLVTVRDSLPRKPSRSARLARRLEDAKGVPQPRKDETRAKRIMGRFLIDQANHEPSLRVPLTVPLAEFLSRGGARVSNNNWALLTPVFQAWGASDPVPVGALRHRAESRVRIVLGAFALQLMDTDADLRRRLLPGIEPFLLSQPVRSQAENRRVLGEDIRRWNALDSLDRGLDEASH